MCALETPYALYAIEFFFSVGTICPRLRAPIKITMSILEGNIMRSRFRSEWSAWFCRNVVNDYSNNGM